MTTRFEKKSLKFNLICTDEKVPTARCGLLTLAHGEVETPVFMPVGTQGVMKGVTVDQLLELDCRILLGNTYHLGNRPGPEVLQKMGGLHKFMNWPRCILTDSGGFQMVSLTKLARVTEQGVEFQSPHDSSMMMLTPEESMRLQNTIGADIMMALDDVIPSTTEGDRVPEATQRTLRWIDRCKEAHQRQDEQNLFGITQGGLDLELREQCLNAMVSRQLPGYAIGGLSGGESKDLFWRVVGQSAPALPDNQPRYLMGVGYALDLVVCVCLGVDMFDCVSPTRTARFGRALVDSGQLELKSSRYAQDFRPIDETCDCRVCRTHTRAQLHLLATRQSTGAQLISLHNIAYQLNLMRRLRNNIRAGTLTEFVQQFVSVHCPKGAPKWAKDALASVKIAVP